MYISTIQKTVIHRVSSSIKTLLAFRNYSVVTQQFDWEDPLNVRGQLTDEEITISQTAESYCQEQMLPRVLRKLSLGLGP